MAQTWVPTRRRRLALGALDLYFGARKKLERRAPNPGGVISRILVVEMWNIGDVVLLLPFLSQLKAKFPAAEITLLAGSHASELLAGTGLVDEFIHTTLGASPHGVRFAPLRAKIGELRRVGRELRRRQFDLAFVCRMHVREHLILEISGAKRRIGYAFNSRSLALTDALPVRDPHQHKSADWLGLLEPFGGVVELRSHPLTVSEAERRAAVKFLEARGIGASETIVGIHPGASVRAKRWPLERFRTVASEIARRRRARLLAFVDPEDYGSSLAGVQGVVLCKGSVREMTALIARCSVLVCNDSGPMHIAGGLGIPTVAVFASGIDGLFAPLGEGHQLVSASETGNIGDDDVESVSTLQVLDALDRVLAYSASKA